MKIEFRNQSVTPALLSKNVDGVEPIEKVPAIFKPFAGKTPAQFLAKYIHREKLEAMAGAAAGFVDLGLPIPEWTKNASCQFWKNYIGDRPPLDPSKSAEDFGVMVEMIRRYILGDFNGRKPITSPTILEKFCDKIAGKFCSIIIEKAIPTLSNEEKSQFYAGCARAEKIIERLQDTKTIEMVKRANVYLLIATAWRQIESLKSHAERERWLRPLLEEKEPKFKSDVERELWVHGTEGKKFSAKRLSSREYYDIFQIVGLPGAAPGRPKNSEI